MFKRPLIPILLVLIAACSTARARLDGAPMRVVGEFTRPSSATPERLQRALARYGIVDIGSLASYTEGIEVHYARIEALARVAVCVTSVRNVDIDLIEAKLVLATGEELGPTDRLEPCWLESLSRTTYCASWYEP